MLHIRVFAVVIMFVALMGPVAPAQTREAELLEAEERLTTALMAGDADAFESLLAAEFVLRGAPDVSRDAWIQNALKLCWGDQFEIGDFRVVSVSPEIAIVTLVLTTNRDPASCRPASVRSLLTDVWRRENESWRLALRHSGPAGSSVAVQFAKTAPPPPLVEGSVELSLVSTGGNSDTETLGVSGSLTWRPGEWTTQGQASFIRSEAFDVESARSLVAAVRQGRAITPRLDAFGRLEFLVNEFAGIEHRISLEAGLGYKPVDNAVQTLRLDFGFGYSQEARLSDTDLKSAQTNIAAIYRRQLHRAAFIENTSHLTASFDRAGDWRFRNALAATATMTRLLSLKLASELKYVNVPVAGFQKADRTFSAALVARF